jgi:hypothetical protein
VASEKVYVSRQAGYSAGPSFIDWGDAVSGPNCSRGSGNRALGKIVLTGGESLVISVKFGV